MSSHASPPPSSSQPPPSSSEPLAACDLTKKKCLPCEGGSNIQKLDEEACRRLATNLPSWELHLDQAPPRISRGLRTKNFKTALELVNHIGAIAEGEGHHPDIRIHSYNKVLIELSTHSLQGLTENDFIVAAKIDAIPHLTDLLSKKRSYTDA